MTTQNRKFRILVIDDDVQLVESSADYFRQMLNAIVFTASSMHQAVMAIDDQGPFDILVSDYQIPPFTAVDLARHLRNALDKTPLLLHSGFDSIDEGEFEDSNYLGLVAKPDIRGLVRRILERFPDAKRS
jgi:DNA-binding NtrC family response regulator